jgi:hypothetical protein
VKASDIPVVAGWKLLPDYAEPATAGGGYCEVQPNGDFEVAYEVDGSLREMGVNAFLLTHVPAEVIRALLTQYDARQAILSDAANHDEKTEPNNARPEPPVRRDGRREPTSTETDG